MERARKKLKSYSQLEVTLIIFVVIFAIVSFTLLICLMVNRDEDPICYTSECINAAYHILNTVDQAVDPCDDFYKFSCGNFLKDAIARDQVSPLDELDDLKKNGLKQIVIEELESEENMTGSFRKQRKYYKACMNTTSIQDDKDQTFLTVLKEVTGGWPLSQGYNEDLHWAKIMVKAREKGLKFDHFLDVDIRLEHNTTSVYVEVTPPSENNFNEHLWTEANLQKIKDMADYWGKITPGATWELRQTIEFATKLNKVIQKGHDTIENKTLEDRKTTISDIKNFSVLTMSWLEFLKSMTKLQNLSENDVIILSVSEDYLKDLDELIRETKSKKYWINYIALLIITDEYRFLSQKIENMCKDILSPTKYSNRRDYCFKTSTIMFDGVAEAEYVRKVVTEDKRDHIREIIKNIKTELVEALNTNKWMDGKTKESAVKHLENVAELIGWTDIVFNATEYDQKSGFDKLNLKSDNIIEMNQELNKFYYDSRFKHVGTNLSNYFDMILSSPLLEVNAFYIKYVQVLILVAPILNSPVYGQNRPEYMNYGSLGSIIGHEFTHALSKVEDDCQIIGKKPQDYWSNETHVNYDNEVACLNEEYEMYMEKLNVSFSNATDTLDENVADFTGLNLAYQAYQKWVDHHGTEKQLPGVKYSPNQLFWIMASTYRCLEPKLQESKKSNGHGRHAVASFRVVGPIRNSPHFGKDFGCPEGSEMNPKNKCRLFV